MRTIIQILSAALIGIFSLFCITVVNAVEISDSEIVNDVMDIVEIQAAACSAHEALFRSFDWNGTYIYPEDFGGDYIDYDTLHILLTDDADVDKYKNLLKQYSDVIIFDTVEYSYGELSIIANDFVSQLPEECEVLYYEVNIPQNNIIITTQTSSYEMVREALALSQVNSTFNNKQYILLDELIVLASEDGGYRSEVSVVNGQQVKYIDNESIYSLTLGGSGRYNGSVAYVTAGHCPFSVGDKVYAGNSVLGTVKLRNFKSNSYGDYSIFAAQSGYTASNQIFSSSGNVVSITGVYYNPAVGTYVYKYGQESGQAYCKITNVNVTVYAGTVSLLGMTKAQIISGTTAEGDSGGPYRSGNNYCGVHSGSSTTASGITYVYFTPYVYLYKSGFIVATS